MSKGISVFVGMNYSLEENKEYITKAKKSGFDSLFTSLHIPEADYKKSINDFKEITRLCKDLDMNIVADISPRAFEYLDADMNNLKIIKELGIYGIRVDFGFSPKEIADFTRNPYELKIEINASTVTQEFLNELNRFNPNYDVLQACHNYYPRINTGISMQTFLRKNSLLKQYNMKISAFIPSLVNKRGPISEGLPTLEIHRFMDPQVSAKHLYAMGIDNVIFGDSIPSSKELEDVGGVREDVLEFRIETYSPSDTERAIMFSSIHQNRPDSADDVIRSTNSRTALKNGDVINSNNNIDRNIGYVTIDNKNYLRYCGELQICKKDLPADWRVNVTGKIVEDELFLIPYIQDETKFMLREVLAAPKYMEQQ